MTFNLNNYLSGLFRKFGITMYSVDELRQKVNYYWSATLGARTVTEIDSYKKDIDTLENGIELMERIEELN